MYTDTVCVVLVLDLTCVVHIGILAVRRRAYDHGRGQLQEGMQHVNPKCHQFKAFKVRHITLDVHISTCTCTCMCCHQFDMYIVEEVRKDIVSPFNLKLMTVSYYFADGDYCLLIVFTLFVEIFTFKLKYHFTA